MLKILELNKIYNEDCLEGMKRIDDKSIDMILCDLPYGTTACKWDTIIPMKKFVKTTNRQGKFIIQYENEYIVNQLKITDKSYLYIRDEFNEKAENGLWEHYERIIKDNGAIVLCGSQPFTAELIHSNLKGYKYNWVWEKSKASNFIQVKNQPLKNYEDVCVFTANGETSNYYPQMTDGEPYKPRAGKKETEVYNTIPNHMFRNGSDGKRYPKAIQYFKTSESEGKVLHPTQKPVALFEYLIRTYTNEGETVLDNCMGSGTTAIACINTKRNYIGFEKDTTYCNLAEERIKNT